MSRIISKSDLKEWLAYEKRIYDIQNDFIARIKSFLGCEREIIYFFQRRLRYTEYYKNSGHKMLYYISQILLQRYQRKYALNIDCNVCGKGLKIMHLGPILTNGRAHIGENVKLHVNTHIVAGGSNDDVPIIGNNVVIGVGAVVLGRTIIADGIAIGANAVVNKSFQQPNITIAGVPAKKISDKGRDSWGK